MAANTRWRIGSVTGEVHFTLDVGLWWSVLKLECLQVDLQPGR